MVASLSMTQSRVLLDVANPDWRAINLFDVAHGLANTNRFCGHPVRQVSVLEHSLAVARIVPAPLKLAALLHDGHEAFMGDWPRPAVAALAKQLAALGVREARVTLDAALDMQRLGLDIAIARQVLDIAGERCRDPDEEAVRLAAEMRSPEVVEADRLCGEAELALFLARSDPALVAVDYAPQAPHPATLVTLFGDMLESFVMARFGHRRVPRERGLQ